MNASPQLLLLACDFCSKQESDQPIGLVDRTCVQLHTYLKYDIVFCTSGSEAGPLPQYVSLQGLSEPPPCRKRGGGGEFPTPKDIATIVIYWEFYSECNAFKQSPR